MSKSIRDTTIVVPYYRNAGMLAKQLEMIATYPQEHRDALTLIVVDDGSPEDRATVPENPPCKFELFRIKVDVRWNQDAARNLGVHYAKTKWLMLTDIDHLIPPETMKAILMQKVSPEIVYRFRRVSAPDNSAYHPHPNSWFMNRKRWDASGGYDERFAGYYGTDADFRDRLMQGGAIEFLEFPLIRVGREVIPDASTVHYKRKESFDGENIIRIKNERAAIPHWKPITLSFPWERVVR